MNLIDTGMKKIIEELRALDNGWDGYYGLPIHKDVIDKLRDMNFLAEEIIHKFRCVGIPEHMISIIPMSDGRVQCEGKHNNVYLEIEIGDVTESIKEAE